MRYPKHNRLTLPCIALLLVLAGSSNLYGQFDSWTPRNADGDITKVTCIAFDDTIVWVGTEKGGVIRYDGKSETPFNKQNGALTTNNVRAVAVGADRHIWIGTDKGLSRWDGKKMTHILKDQNALPTEDVTAIHIDADGIVWVGTTSGLARFAQNKWTVFTKDNTSKVLPSNEITSIHSNWNGTIWVGTPDGIAQVYKDKWKKFGGELENFLSNEVRDLTVAEDGSAWIATPKGVGAFINQSWKFFLKGKEISAVATDRAGQAWAATRNEGLVRISGGKETPYLEGLSSKELLAVRTDDHGDVWFGTTKGLHRHSDASSAELWSASIFRRAEELRLLRDPVRAKRFYSLYLNRAYFASTKESPNAYFRLAQMASSQGNSSGAKDLFTQLTKLFPKHALVKDALISLGDLAAQEKRLAEAQQHYQLYLDNYPDDDRQAEILWKMGNLLEKDGDTFGASRFYQKLNNKFPKNVHFDEIRLKFADMEEKQGRKDAAAQLHQEILASASDFEVLSRLADVYDLQHRRDVMADLKGTLEWKSFDVGSGVNYMFLEGTDMWLGTQNSGVLKWDISANAYTTYNDGLTGQNIRQVYIDADHDIWAIVNGIAKNSLLNMQYSKKKTKWVPMGSPFNTKQVNAIIYRQSTKSIIAATDQGLIIMGGGSKTYSSKNGLPSDQVRFAQEDSKGILWMVVGKQLVELYKEPKMIMTGDGISFNDVRGMYVDANDTKWLATDRGVVTFDGTWKQYTTTDGLISNDVQCVVGHGSGKILVGTKQGLSFHNKTFWMNYTEEDGLPSNDVRAVIFAEDESIWIGTNKGFHYRKSSGEGDKKLMVQNVLAQEEKLWEKKKFAESRELYKTVAVYADLTDWIEFKTSLTKLKEGDANGAWTGFASLMKRSPTSKWMNDVYLYRIARQLEGAGKTDAAFGLMAQLAPKVKDHPQKSYRIEESLFRISQSLQSGKTDVALSGYRSVRDLFPQSLFLPQIADQLCIQASDLLKSNAAQAIALYEEVWKQYPTQDARLNLRLILAELYEKNSRATDAEKMWEDIVKTTAKNDPLRMIAEARLARLQRMKS